MKTINELVNAILLGDCVKVMKEMPWGCVDLIVTDPPYLVDYRDRDGRRVANDTNDAWLEPAFMEMYRVLKNDSFCVSFYSWNKVDSFFSRVEEVWILSDWPLGLGERLPLKRAVCPLFSRARVSPCQRTP